MRNKRVLKVLSAVLSGILLLETPMSSFATEASFDVLQESDRQFVQENEIVTEDEIEQDEQEVLPDEQIEDTTLEEENLLELEVAEQTSEGVLLKFVPQEGLSFYEIYRQAKDEEEELLLAELEEVQLEEDGTSLYLDEVSEANTYTYWMYGYEEKAEENEELLPVSFGGFVELEILAENEMSKEDLEAEEEIISEEITSEEALPEEDAEKTEEAVEETEEITEVIEETVEATEEITEAVEEIVEKTEEIELSEEVGEAEEREFSEFSAASTSLAANVLENSKDEIKEAVIEAKETQSAKNDESKTKEVESSNYLVQPQTSTGTIRNLKAEDMAYNKIKVSWEKIEGAKGYYIYYKTSNMSYELLKVQGGNSYTFSKAVCGVDYSFKVCAYTKVGSSIHFIAESEVGPVKTELAIPDLNVSKVSYTQTILKWKKITGAKKYEIECSASRNGTYYPVNAGTNKAITGTSYTHKQGLEAGKTYYYKIRAVLNENYATDWSEPIEVKLKAVEVTQGKVENVKAEATAYNKIKITWNKQAKANGYEIYYATNATGPYSLLKKQGGNSYTFNNAECGTTYYFRVHSYQKADGILYNGQDSDVASAKADLVVSSLQLTKVGYTQAALKWKSVTGATAYELYVSESKSDGYRLLDTVKSTSYTHKGLTPGKTYYYKLKALRNTYKGADSNVVEANALYIEVTMSSVKNLTATPSTYNTIQVSWDKLTGAKGYQLWYKTAPEVEYELLNTQTSNSFKFTKAECGVTYYFSVQAYQVIEGEVFYGDLSPAVTVMTELEIPVPNISSVSYNQVAIKWNAITGATSYEVYVSQSQNGAYSLAGTSSSTSYTDKTVDINKTYYYKIKAVREKAEVPKYSTEFSQAVWATVLYDDLTGLKASSTDDGKITVSWKAVPGMTTYVVERYTSEEDALNDTDPVSFETSKSSYTDSGLKINTRYYYKVYGYNDSYQTNVEGPVSAKTKIVEEDTGTYVRYGVDVSSYQGNIDWSKVYDSGIRFAMLRILVKSGNKDIKFEENYTNARKAGVKVGVYKYTYATTAAEARAEAKAVIAALDGRKLDYPVALDLEDKVQEGLSNAQRTEIVLAYKDVVESAGYKFVVYASKYWFDAKLDMNRLSNVELWIARWRDLSSGHGYTGKGKVTMWQYSDAGRVNGISGNVDMDVSYKKY